MKTAKLKLLANVLGMAVIGFVPGLNFADDTDIYVNSDADVSPPLVMLSLDLRPNLASTVCSEGDLLITVASLVDNDGNLIPSTTVDADFACPSAAYLLRNGGDTMIADLTMLVEMGEKLTRFDVLIGALKSVLKDLTGIQVGLMLNHNHITGCAGPANEREGCSNGGYIALGFNTLLADDSNGQRAALFGKLSAAMAFRAANIEALSGEITPSPTPTATPAPPDNACELDSNGDIKDSDGDGTPDDKDYCPNVKWQNFSRKESNKYPGCPNGTNAASTTPLCTPPSGDSGGGDDLVTSNGNQIQSHSYQGRELFFEFFRYLTGQGIYNGHNGYDDYYKGSAKLNLPDDAPALMWDQNIESGSLYQSPLNSDVACSRIYTINSLFFVANQEADSDDAIVASKAGGGMGGIDLSGPNKSFSTVIEYLNDADLADGSYNPDLNFAGKQNVISYFIVDESKINTTTIGYSQAGGTGSPLPLGDNAEDLANELLSVFRQILSVSTTFVSASVPVNVFNRASIVDNVYIALFQADEDDRPYWPGNVKKLKIEGLESGTPALRDVNGAGAVASDGRINFDALTYWSKTGSDYQGDLLLPGDPDPTKNIFEDRDGRIVARGGAGQNIPGFIDGFNTAGDAGVIGDFNDRAAGTRLLYWDNGNTLDDLEVDSDISDLDDLLTILINKLGLNAVLDPVFGTFLNIGDLANQYVRYMRGQDLFNADNDFDNNGDPITDDARPWIFGDPLHAKPLPLNYGAFSDSTGSYTEANPAIYIAVGSNDGYLRLIRNTTAGASGAESGEELWAFMPQEAFGIQGILAGNRAGDDHPYGSDGAPVGVVTDINGNGTIEPAAGDKVIVVFGMRRGGRNVYALDITNPEVPKLAWKITPTSAGSDFAEIGYTFSTPQTGKMVDSSGNDINVLVFGGGYDFNKDAHSLGSNDTIGNAIYVVNADTGDLIWKATRTGAASSSIATHSGMVDSIAADVTAVDTDSDGYLDRIIAVDTGGSVWRADVHSNASGQHIGNSANWTINRLARLGRHDVSTRSQDRRFFHAADIVPSRDESAFDAIVVVSGDRANPLDKPAGSTAPVNYAFMIKDRNISPGSAQELDYVPSDLGDVTDSCDSNGCVVDSSLIEKGWRFKLEGAEGEKGLAVPLTVGGTVFFTSYLPPGAAVGNACAPAEGSGRLYAVNLADGSAAFNFNKADDDEGNPDDEANSDEDRFDDLLSGGIPAEVVFIPPGKILAPDLTFRDTKSSNRLRTYWQLVEPQLNHSN